MYKKSETGVFNERYGMFNGKRYLFTHRNPENGYLWSDNIPDETEFGAWVPSEMVTLEE